MIMVIVKMMIMLMLMLMLMLSCIAFFNTVGKENYGEVHPRQSALAIAHHGRQALQHHQFCSTTIAPHARRLYSTACMRAHAQS